MSPVARLISRQKRFLTAVGVLVTAMATPAVALAYFHAYGSGTGSANVGNLNPPTGVIATAANGSTSIGASPVTITWTAPASGVTPSAYKVERGTTLLSCTASPCTDTGVPDGSYTYHVLSIYRSWTSSTADSNSLTIKNDTTPPTTAPSLVGSSHAFLAGTGPYTLYFKGDTSGSFQLADAVTDTASGPGSANFPGVSATAWSGHTSGELVSSGTGSAPTITYTSSAGSPYQWTSGAGTPADASVTARDVAGNATADTVHFISDTSAPTGGSVTVKSLVGTGSLYSNSKAISLTLAQGSDGTGSGLAASGNVLQREEGTLSSSNGILNGACDYTGKSFTNIATDPPTGAYIDSVSDNNACYRYRYLVTDHVGNVAAYASSDVKVETTAPASLVPSNATITAATGAGFQFETTVGVVPTVYYNPAQTGSFTVDSAASDATSGVVKTTFPNVTGFSGGGDQTSPNSGGSYRTTYSWSNNGGSTPAANQSISATDNATLSATNTSAFAIVKDNSGPSGSIASSGTTGNIGLTATSVADTGSGTASVAYYRCTTSCTSSTPLTVPGNWTLIGTSTTSAGFWPVSWDSTTVANGNYTLQAVLTDNVSNQALTGNRVTVAVNNVYSFAVGAISSPQRAGTPFGGFTIQLQVNGGDTGSRNGSSYAGSHTITFGGSATANSPLGNPATGLTQSLTFSAAGQATVANITLFKAEAGGVLTATDSTNAITGTSATFATDSGGVALTYSGPACPFSKAHNWTQQFAISVPVDAYGNAFTSANGLALQLTFSGGSTGSFSFNSLAAGAPLTLTITSGPANTTFSVSESGANKTTSVTASAPSGFTPPASCSVTGS